MFTGIVQAVATVAAITDRPGLRSFTLAFPPGFLAGQEIGASVACDGTCLTVTRHAGADQADFDVMQQSLALTTLGRLAVGDRLNVERAARDGAEIGGHPISGHVDFQARVAEVRRPENNHVLRIAVPAPWMRYVFPKGYIAVNGASLTVAEAGRAADGSGWFEVWLIPETLRQTTFGSLQPGDALNLEIERGTQVMVDTVRATLEERLGPLLPALEALLRERGVGVEALAGLPAAGPAPVPAALPDPTATDESRP
ncbi:MAG: riboflavin synthase subunit alpha [Burkholderiaceae bacterium]|nr:riboflavin synthase subunit alpha [Burkholderiaceae bacterium]